MKNISNYIAALLAIAVYTSCADHSSQQKEVEELHDVIMARNFQLNDLIDSIELLTAGKTLDSIVIQKFDRDKIIRNLQTSDRMMMKWMKDYGDSIDLIEKSEKLIYLDRQKVVLSNIKEITFSSIEEARQFLTSVQAK
jgi:hypothetical protein